MNNWNGSGFISSDINIKEITTKNGEAMKMARFSIACQRKGKNAGADFISCVAYGKNAEFCERWMHKASGVEIRGHIQTGSYEGKNGKVYTTDVICDEFEFPKAKKGETYSGNDEPQEQPQHESQAVGQPMPQEQETEFMKIPDQAILDSLPFR